MEIGRKHVLEERFLYFRHNFISLPIGMKNVVMKISALLLSVWYCLSIIGFDVHTCSSEGVSHVMTSFTSIDCETIHGDHRCSGAHHHDCDHPECHAHHAHGAAEDCSCKTDGETHIHTQKCCTDDYQTIVLTGVRVDENHSHYDECHCGNCPCVEATACDALSLLLASVNKEKHIVIPDSGLIVPEVQALFGIWRI